MGAFASNFRKLSCNRTLTDSASWNTLDSSFEGFWVKHSKLVMNRWTVVNPIDLEKAVLMADMRKPVKTTRSGVNVWKFLHDSILSLKSLM